jgi:hypothetical protein
MYDPVELPSLEQIEQMERRRDKALDAVEISVSESGEPRTVKSQRCNKAVPIVAKIRRPINDRVVILQKRIKWIETHYHVHHGNAAEDYKALKQELSELLEKDAKADKLRSIPLQYWRGKYVCGACLDRLVCRAR